MTHSCLNYVVNTRLVLVIFTALRLIITLKKVSHLIRPLQFIVVGVALWSIWYFIVHIQSQPFVESATDNLFATILGVLVGLPIALEINQRQQAASEYAAAKDRKDERNSRRRKVLKLLQEELQRNLDGVAERLAPIALDEKRAVFTHSLRNQLWLAFADGGELHCVDNPLLLARLADAYHEIAYCILLEHKYFDAVHYSGMRIQQEKYPTDHILEYLDRDDSKLIDMMRLAKDAIASDLAAMPEQ